MPGGETKVLVRIGFSPFLGIARILTYLGDRELMGRADNLVTHYREITTR